MEILRERSIEQQQGWDLNLFENDRVWAAKIKPLFLGGSRKYYKSTM